MNKNKIFGVILLIAALGVAGFYLITSKNNKVADLPIDLPSENSIVEDNTIDSSLDGDNKEIQNNSNALNPTQNSLKDRAWQVLSDYLEFAKNGNIDGVRGLTYKLSSVCEDSRQSEDCKARMASVYYLASWVKKEDMKYIWSDDKQIIMATEFKNSEDENIIVRSRMIVFYMIVDGKIKLVRFNTEQGAYLTKTQGSKAELEARLLDMTKDSDTDGLEDYVENCEYADENTACAKTDPKNKDTDNDGIWDGVEAQIAKIS